MHIIEYNSEYKTQIVFLRQDCSARIDRKNFFGCEVAIDSPHLSCSCVALSVTRCSEISQCMRKKCGLVLGGSCSRGSRVKRDDSGPCGMGKASPFWSEEKEQALLPQYLFLH
jgi:hypothetical protein